MDIVTYEILRSSLYAAAREMKLAMMRTAGSPIVHSGGDASAAVFDAEMQLVAQGNDIPTMLGSAALTLLVGLIAYKLNLRELLIRCAILTGAGDRRDQLAALWDPPDAAAVRSMWSTVREKVRARNKVIDVNYYPIPQAHTSNMRHRPIGLGVQGLADAFILLGMPFDSEAAKQLNIDIFETIYYAAVSESCNQAEKHGAYESFQGSPMSKGMFQFDLWGVTPTKRWDWDSLRERVKKVGVRNSLLVAPMPTASTSQILGNNECFEPYTSNLYTRRTLAGEHIVVNKHLMRDLVRLGLWNEEMREAIMAANGSIQGIDIIPKEVRDIYKTAYEISQKVIIDMAADRGAYICQSQSLNIFMENANFGKLTSMHFYAWKAGLKTGMYYLRTKAATDAIKFTVDKSKLAQPAAEKVTVGHAVGSTVVLDPVVTGPTVTTARPVAAMDMSPEEYEAAKLACSLDNPDACEMCSG